MTEGRCVEVALPFPMQNSFTYRVDPEQQARAQIGVRVRVPFKNRETTGFLVGFSEAGPERRLKKIIEVTDNEPVLSSRLLCLTRWMADYYFSSWGEAIEAAVPHWVRLGKRVKVAPQVSKVSTSERPAPLTLTVEQEKALSVIRATLQQETPKPILLYGITGSGKTELYIRAIQDVLGQGKAAIVLVPEIALTEQIRRFFFEHFSQELALLHSKLSDGERFGVWKQVETGEKRVLLGPRSAIFAPMPNLGLILIDEEHEGSYKQDSSPRYHAREVAVWRAREERALLILGSATPSLESMDRAEKGIFQRVDLTKRIENKALPGVTIVDLKREREAQRGPVILSRRLAQEIETNLERKEGTLILLNRRGFSTQVICPVCGEVVKCPSCEVSLTFHQQANELLCHFCNFRCEPPSECKRCKKPLLRFTGFGTEKVESELSRLLPKARIARMDTDSVRRRGSHERILQDFRDRKIDILVGTQMIAKGFDFPHVTLVGVVLADVGLVLPDFRASERTFQLLTQVAGRAGRGAKPGRVIVQTFSPGHPSIALAKDHDYLTFFREEMKKRNEHGYPPSKGLVNFLIRSREEKKAYLFAREVRENFKRRTEALGKSPLAGEIEIIGPAPLPYYRLRGHYRWHVLVKTPEMLQTLPLLRETLGGLKRRSGVACQVDVDPLSIL